MLWNIFRLDNDFNYNADPSPTPKYFELDGLLLINVAIPFYHNQLIALIILEYPFPVVTPSYFMVACLLTTATSFPTQPILLYNLHFVLRSAQDHLFCPIMYYATQPFSVNKYATSKNELR